MAGPARSTTTLSFLTYQSGFQFQQYGYSAAIAYVMVVILIIASTVTLRFVRTAWAWRGHEARRWAAILAYLTLFLIAVVALAPFAYLLLLSTKKRIEIVAQVPPTLNINWDQVAKNYREVIDTMGMLTFVGNSVIVVGIATVIGLVVGTPTAYAFSRMRFRGRETWASTILSFRFMPAVAVAIPIFLMIALRGTSRTRSRA